MARRSARRTYVRDGRGRFASTGTTTAKAKPAARRAQRGTNRITRDNSGKITGVGKNGATARGGRLRTAAGNQRGAVLDRMKRAPMAGTVGKGGKVRGGVVRSTRPARGAGRAQSREARLAGAYLRAERIAGQRKEQFNSAYRTAVEMRLDAQGIKAKKKREAALQGPELQAAAAASRRRDGQRQTSKKRAADLRSAYFQQLSKGTGQKGKVATADRKRYDMLRESTYRLGQSISRDSHNLAYNTNSMGFKEQAKAQARLDRNKRLMQRKQSLIKRLANVSSVSEAPRLQSASAVGKRVKVPQLRPGRRSNKNLSSGAALMQSMPYIVMKNGRLAGSIYPKGRIDKIRAKRAGGSARLRKPAPKPPQPAKLPTGRTVYRTRAQAIRAQRARTNALGKATAAKRGFNQTTAANQRARIAGRSRDVSMFADSAPRTVISRPRIPQLSLSGRVERVGAGRFRTIGERLGGGSIRRPQSKPGPLRGTKAWKRQLNQAIKANGGKDVAAFRF
jgi:hypothetical protein